MVGTGTFWAGNIRAFDRVVGKDGKEAIVASVTDNTHIVLMRPWQGTTQATDVYEIWLSPDEIFLQTLTRAIFETLASSALTGIGGLTPAANTMPYFDAGNAAALATLTTFARSILDDADASSVLTTLGVSTFVKTLLDDAAATNFLTTLGFSTFFKTLIDDADASTVLSTLGVSTFAKTILDDADGPAVLTTLGFSTYFKTLVAAASSTALTALLGVREVLTVNRTYYVRTDGSDSNNGLANTAGGAFLTVQKAIDVAVTLDLGIYAVTIQVGAGTWTAGIVPKSYVGIGPITLQGDTTTPANVTISRTSANCFDASNVRGKWAITGFKVIAATSGYGISAIASQIDVGVMDFGACATAHLNVEQGSIVTFLNNYTISGGSTRHWFVTTGALIQCAGKTITLTGTPALSSGFLIASRGGGALISGNTFTGSATGSRYVITFNAWADVAGGGASYLPGNAAGSVANGGVYA